MAVDMWPCKVFGGTCNRSACKPRDAVKTKSVDTTRYQATVKIRIMGGDWEPVTNGTMEGDAKALAHILHTIADDLEERDDT